MHRATLLYNPAAGSAQQRLALVTAAAEALQAQGVHATTVATTHAGSAAVQARTAIAAGADTVFACGGDGTVHDVLQGLVHQPHAALGILPLGSANVLARHLGLSLSPAEAALQQLHYAPKLIPVGELTCTTAGGHHAHRYFLALAGAGPDGALVYTAAAGSKQRLGRLHYYLHAARLYLSGRFHAFEVAYTLASGEEIRTSAVSAMAVRVGDLGGLFSPLIRGGELEHPHLRLTFVRGPAIATLPAWFAQGHLRLRLSAAETVEVTSFRCTPTPRHGRTYVQADGEALGQTPMEARLIPAALRLLMPISSI